jgi:hypothetical protein
MTKLTAYDKFVQVAIKYGFSLFGTPKTGQTIEYQSGDDGTYQKGKPATLPRFTDNNDGTITDNATGLMWVKDPIDIGAPFYVAGSLVLMDWTTAIINCEALDYANHTDWRLPNLAELISIVNYGNASPAIDQAFFPNTVSDYYWSGTTSAGWTAVAWVIHFVGGYALSDDKSGSYYVRPVRAG